MTKGAILIGCGCEVTQVDINYAINKGHIKNAEVVTTTGFGFEVDKDLAYATYVSISREKGWELQGGLQAVQLTTSDGRRMWSVYPSLDTGIDSESKKKWWQFWK